MTQHTEFDLRHVSFEGRPAMRGCRQPEQCVCKALGLPQTALRDAQPPDAEPPEAEPVDGLACWLIDQAGLVAGIYRDQPLRRRLPACLRTLKVPSADAARALLTTRPDLLPAAISSLLIGVTEFFRDPDVFACVQHDVLPRLAGRAPLRVWSAACSSGEELYSLAIVLAEARLLESSVLLGSDCRPDAVEQARAAVYRAAAMRLVEPAIRGKYFQAAGEGWRPNEALRRQVHWKMADLAQTVERGPWDIILWRNVAIYLNAGPAETIWKQLAGALAPGGYLIVGKAERPPAGLGLLPMGRCIYRRSGS